MKRLLPGLLVLGLVFSSVAEAAISPTQTSGNNWWSRYFSRSNPSVESSDVEVKSTYRPVNYRSFLNRYYRTRSKSNTTTTPKTYVRPRTTTSRYTRSSYGGNSNTSNRNYYTSYRSTRGSSYRSRNGATVTVNTTRPSKAITQMLDDPIPVFDIGVRNDSYSSSSTLPQVYLLRGMSFEIIDRDGVFTDFSNFILSVNGSEQRFTRNGDIDIRFIGSNRITRGDALDLEVELKLDEVDIYPRIRGGLRIRLVDTDVISESTGNSVPTSLVGRSTSEFLAWDPFPSVSTGGTSQLSVVTSKSIYGRTLGAGESWDVLSMDLKAHDDDLIIEEITVRDSLSGGDIDGWTDGLEAIDGRTGRSLGRAYFVNGAARFSFSPGLEIYREQNRAIYFRIHVRSRINTSSQNTSFKLDIAPADIEVYGIGAGSNLPTANKVINTNTDTFFVSGGSGVGGVSHGPQPQLIPTGNPTPAYRFTVNNLGSRYLSLGRVTAQIYPNALDFAGGSLSAGDLQISEYQAGNEQILSANVSVPSSNVARFDFTHERLISPRSGRTFTIWVATENPTSDLASLSFQLLGDSSLNKGNLSSVKSSGANFIWSDHSDSPHSMSSSDDWINGYLFNGLPTGNQLNKY